MAEIDLEQERAALRAIHAQDRRAHFETDVDLLLAAQGEEFISVANGAITRATRAETAAQFTEYFAGATYQEWDDLEPPILDIAEDASRAWMIVRTRVRRTQTLPDGTVRARAFVYAGIMTYAKQDGHWVRTANVSTFAPDAP